MVGIAAVFLISAGGLLLASGGFTLAAFLLLFGGLVAAILFGAGFLAAPFGLFTFFGTGGRRTARVGTHRYITVCHNGCM